uniref:F-box domain-containing protein n=1 Tax=Moniliophthora roreri TaxID=221103 RepID=A0A0W0G908_MONRR
MPRAQITSLKLDCFIHDDALEYLVSFPNLQTLHLRCTGHDPEPYAASAGDKDICDFIALQSAVIEVEDDKQASFLFRYCTVPQLTEAIGLLKLLPTLTTLRIEELERKPNNRIITTSFLDTLHVNQHSNSTTFLPRLTSLFLRIHAVSLDSSALVKAMTSRWAPDPVFATDMGIDRIRSIGIELMWQMSPWKRSPPDTPRKVFEPLRCLGDAGAKYTVHMLVKRSKGKPPSISLTPGHGYLRPNRSPYHTKELHSSAFPASCNTIITNS